MKHLGLRQVGVAAIQSALEAHAAVLVNDVEDDDALLGLAGELGTIIEPGVRMGRGAHDGRIYSVEARCGGDGQRDRHGNLVLSTTAAEFPLHTDGYNRAVPPRYVLLMRADRTVDQTESFSCDAPAAVGALPEDTAKILERPIFPSARGLVALRDHSDGIERLRFNRHEIGNWSKDDPGAPLTKDAASAVDALEEALTRRKESFQIGHGECLVLDNWRSCHGRGPIAPESKRILRRAWVL